MSNSWLENVHITNVQQRRINEENMVLTFSMNGLPYTLTIKKREGLFVPLALFHEFDEICPNCLKIGTIKHCFAWLEEKEKLFHYLIKQPSIRLEWVYIPHEQEVEEDAESRI